MPKLTKTVIDHLKPAGAETYAWCAELPGFGVRVLASGRKTYVARYRTAAGQQRKQMLGRCCDLAPEKAREMARKVFALVAEGKDPMAERAEKAARQQTVADLRDRYMAEHARPFKKPASVVNDEGNWRLHIIPRLGGRLVRDLTKADVTRLVGELAAHRAVANQCIALLSKAFALAEEWGWRAPGTNPCRGVKKFKLAERETILSLEDICALETAMVDLHAEGRISRGVVGLIRLLLLTGCRLTEIMHAERAWVDADRRLLLLPDSKTGQRRIALSAAAMQEIEDLPAGRWLIAGRTADQHMVNPHGAWSMIKARARLPARMRLHDLRHSVGSLGHMAGLTQRQVKVQLGHKNMATTERYLHGSHDEAAMVAEKVAAIIQAARASAREAAAPVPA